MRPEISLVVLPGAAAGAAAAAAPGAAAAAAGALSTSALGEKATIGADVGVKLPQRFSTCGTGTPSTCGLGTPSTCGLGTRYFFLPTSRPMQSTLRNGASSRDEVVHPSSPGSVATPPSQALGRPPRRFAATSEGISSTSVAADATCGGEATSEEPSTTAAAVRSSSTSRKGSSSSPSTSAILAASSNSAWLAA